MIKAFYTAASGMVAQSIKQDVIANNIANAQTPGFKRERIVETSFQDTLDKTITAVEKMSGQSATSFPMHSTIARAEAANDTSQGSIRPTDVTTQFAISGAGTFEVGSGANLRQTRDGSFIVDKDGYLTTPDGEQVQGKTGPIQVPTGEWSVANDGSIIDAKGNVVNQIKVSGADSKTQVLQSCLEESNVNTVREMVDMIANMRSYEANQRVITSVDGTLDKLINEAGKV